MKKVMTWLFAGSIFVFVIDWGVVGVKLMNGEYDIEAGVYIALACVAVMTAYIIYRIATNRCPHCGGFIYQSYIKYCPHCGKEVKQPTDVSRS